MIWQLPYILTRIRQLIGLPQQYQVSDAELTNRVNDYYCNRMPGEMNPAELLSTYRFTTVGAVRIGTGDGVTTVFSGMLNPIPGVCGVLFSDSVETFKSTELGVLMGTYGGAGTINYATGAYSFTFNTAPIVGAQIGVVYDTYTLPDWVQSIQNPLVVAGFPMTLVEDPVTFWARWPEYQPYYIGGSSPPIYMPSMPQDALDYDGRITLRPVPDKAYLFEATALLKPMALSGSAAPVKDLWGPLIAYSTAIEWLTATGDLEEESQILMGKDQALQAAMTPDVIERTQVRAKGQW